MFRKLSYPYRTIIRNTNPELNLDKAIIYPAEGVRSQRSWKPRGGKWKKSKYLEPYGLMSSGQKEPVVAELVNEYLLSTIDNRVKIPRRPKADLSAYPDIWSEVNVSAFRENPLELMFMQDIVTQASHQLSLILPSGGKLKGVKAGFEFELTNRLKNQVKGNVSVCHITVTIETGLPVSKRLIESWKTVLETPLIDFLQGRAEGLIIDISGVLLKGFKGGAVTVGESVFSASACAAIDGVVDRNFGKMIEKTGIEWAKQVNDSFELTIGQMSGANAFYPLWIQVIEQKDV